MTATASRKLWVPVLAAWLLLAAGCSPPPAPRASPVRLRLVVAPSTARLVERLGQEYGARETSVQLEASADDTDAALEAVATGQADLALVERQLEPVEKLDPDDLRPRLRSWPLANDGLAVVVHPTNPVQTLTFEQLRRAFSGEERYWSGLGGAEAIIQVVSREPGAPARVAFERTVLPAKRVAQTAVVMPNDRAVADYVAKHPEAIGYLSLASLPGGVKVIGVDGVLPAPVTVASGAYPLSRALVLVTPIPLSGKGRAFVDLLFSADGQRIVADLYAPPQ